MIRFFAPPQNIFNNEIALSAQDAEHIRSLRLKPNELFVVCDGNGTDYICHLSENPPDGAAHRDIPVAQILSRQKSHAEPSVRCTVYMAYTKGERLDYAVQKSVELGANKIVLFKSSRCIAVPKDISRKVERLSKIALETAKQCGRGVVPDVTGIGEFTNVVNVAAVHSDLALMCYEEEKNLEIMTVMEHYFPFVMLLDEPKSRVKSIAVITGPEGGFEPSEAEHARERGIPVVSLGNRILRSETAPVVALSVIMYHTGNL